MLQLYITSVTMAGGAWLAYLLETEVTWDLAALGEMALVAFLLAVAGWFPLKVAPTIKADVTTAILFAAVLLLDPGAVALAGVIGLTVYTYFKLGLPWYKYPFNAGVISIYVGLASVVFKALAPDGVLLTPAVVPVAAIMYMANTLLITGAASIQMGNNPIRFWLEGTKGNGPAELSLLAFGFLGALAYEESPWSILALVIPVAIIYLAFSRLTRANEELQEALKKLEALQGQIANDAKLASVGALSVDMAHQIKNPLTILMGRLETLRDHLSMEGSRHLRHASIALEAASRIHELTDSFTSMGQKRWVEMDIRTVLNEAFGMAGLQHRHKVETRWEYAEDLPRVSGNPVLMREALSNILANALDAVKDDGLITTSASRANGSVIVTISDNGGGIPRQIREHLFEPFRTSKPNGSGLGLFAAKHIVEMHKGTLEVESQEGRGTRVTIVLPYSDGRNGSNSHPHLDGIGSRFLAPSE